MGALASLACMAVTCATPAVSATTHIAFSARAPELLPLVACLTDTLVKDGPVVESSELIEGIEFRLSLQTDQDSELITITGLLKPNPSALAPHDDDPESQALAAERFYRLLRVHVGTRAWRWHSKSDVTRPCREAAAWIAPLRARPIMFDQTAAGDEPN